MSVARLLIVGNRGGTHVADSLAAAARGAGLATELVETGLAYGGPRLLRAACWRLGRRPSTPGRLDREVRAAVERGRPAVMIVTGVNPLGRTVIEFAKAAGVRVVNYLTDDPWNPVHNSGRFLRTLPSYDVVFTPRRANMDDLRREGVSHVEYLPFGYDPRHVIPSPEPLEHPIDLLFVGGADPDRVRILGPVLGSGLGVTLFGGYWSNYRETRPFDRGHTPPDRIARATADAAVSLILVRRANRDGHVMRSFEAAAAGGCLLVEDTAEHREIFADAVAYFDSPDALVRQAKHLLADPAGRQHLAASAYRRIVQGGRHTYSDRLRSILRAVGTE